MDYTYRLAQKKDVLGIYSIILYYHQKGLMLFKSQEDIHKDLESFVICSLRQKKQNKNNSFFEKIIACCYLHVYSSSLVEIRSLGVLPNFQKLGIGKKITKVILDLAKVKNYDKIFLLTKEEKFFKKIGFKSCDMKDLPEKVYKDCILCPSHPICEEKALIYYA